MKKIIRFIFMLIVIQLLMMIPILNVFLVVRYGKQTLDKWSAHKNIFWLYSKKVKIVISDGKDFNTIYDGDYITLEFSQDKLHKVIRKTEIKYLFPIDENTVEIRLWNERKINKILGIKNHY